MEFPLTTTEKDWMARFDDLIPGVQRQIEKDFAMENIPVSFKGDAVEMSQLYQELYPAILNIITQHSGDLSRLLYRIDVGEAGLRKQFATEQAGDAVEVITIQILKRELQKVAFRKQYSGQ